MSWQSKLLLVIAATATVYAVSAMVSAVLTDSSRAGCERGNITRGELYKANQSDIGQAKAIIRAVRVGPNAAGIRKAMREDAKRARGALKRLTQDGQAAEPWVVDCTAEYNNPLPWFGQE